MAGKSDVPVKVNVLPPAKPCRKSADGIVSVTSVVPGTGVNDEAELGRSSRNNSLMKLKDHKLIAPSNLIECHE